LKKRETPREEGHQYELERRCWGRGRHSIFAGGKEDCFWEKKKGGTPHQKGKKKKGGEGDCSRCCQIPFKRGGELKEGRGGAPCLVKGRRFEGEKREGHFAKGRCFPTCLGGGGGAMEKGGFTWGGGVKRGGGERNLGMERKAGGSGGFSLSLKEGGGWNFGEPALGLGK